MPRDKTETFKRIWPAAKREFLEKGFEQASMRNIASEVGISAAGLYRHFTDKEAMFAALVDPVIRIFNEWVERLKSRDYTWLEEGNLDEMWSNGGEQEFILGLVYEHFDEFKLLLCCSEGTRYAGFLHELVMMEQRETLIFMEEARVRGVAVKDIQPNELHLLMSAYYSAIFEIVIHDFSREEAEHYIKTLQEFFTPGWRAILGL